jgi:hypothetical protein
MRVYIKSTFTLSIDSGLEEVTFDNRLNPYVMDDSNVAQGAPKNLVLPAVGPSGAYQRVSFDGVAPTYLYIETDTQINILLNSTNGNPVGATPIPIVPQQQQVPAPTPGQLLPPNKAQLTLRTALTAGLDLWIQNPTPLNGAPANVTVVFAA